MTDVCVIGAGAGGAVAATELSLAGLDVTLLERGRAYTAADCRLAAPTWETDPLPFATAEHASAPPQPLPDWPALRSHRNGKPLTHGPRPEAHVLAVQGVGGGTLRFQAIARRIPEPWAPAARFYERVEGVLGVTTHPLSFASRFVRDAGAPAGCRFEPVPTAILARADGARAACIYCAGCAHGCPIGAKSSTDVAWLARAPQVHLVTGAAACRLERGAGDRIAAVAYHDAEGHERRVEARTFVLAAGALETPRLLLLSGVTDAGRGVMESLRVSLTLLCEDRLGSYRGIPTDILCTDFEAAEGFILGLSQSAAGLLGPVAYARRLAPVTRAEHADWMKRYFGNALGLYASAGQPGRPENRISLDERRDRFGVPLARVESRLDARDLEQLDRMRARLLELAAAIPRAHVVEQFTSYDRAPGGAELRGGCADLVDETGRVRALANLYLADASVFPTAGSGNPSLTIMALAARTAEAIRAGR